MLKKWFFLCQKLPTLWVQAVLLILSVLASTTPALAHRVLVFAYAEGDTIHTESKFVPNTIVRQGQVQVLEQKSEKLLLTGKTDDQGKFSFKIPVEAAAQKMDLLIVTEAGPGHRGEWLLKAESYLPGGKTASAASAPAAPPTPVALGTKATVVDPPVPEEALNKALERQLAPVKEMLTELTIHRTSLTDILGGIGYIMGFFGLWAYFQTKGKKKS